MIHFGTFLLMQSPSMRSSQEIYARAVDIAQAAETLGFRNIWLAEHHFSTYGYVSRPAQLATYLAAKTTRLRVGTAVIVVPLHHPLVIAEEIATLDQLAGGRVDIGLGRGYQHYEFERLGLELDTARARWEESVDIILKAFAGKPFTYHGKLFDIPETTIFPQPLQTPHPPIWVTAQSPESVEATVRRGFNLLTGGFGVPIERMADFRRQFDRLIAEVKPPRMPDVGVQRAVYVTDTVEGGGARHRRPRAEGAGYRRPARPLPRHRHAGHRDPSDQARAGTRRHHPLQLQLLVRRHRAPAHHEVDDALRQRGAAGVQVRCGFSTCPPNSKRMAESSRSWKSDSPRELKRW